jgi:hypothetical protein
MRRALALAALAGSAIPFFMPSMPVAAQERQIYPYCLVFYEGPGRYSHQECSFTSIAQCMASASGRGGQCDQNSEWLARPQPVKKARKAVRR